MSPLSSKNQVPSCERGAILDAQQGLVFPGSLGETLAAAGPRVVRFAVEGTIALESRLLVTEGRVTKTDIRKGTPQ